MTFLEKWCLRSCHRFESWLFYDYWRTEHLVFFVVAFGYGQNWENSIFGVTRDWVHCEGRFRSNCRQISLRLRIPPFELLARHSVHIQPLVRLFDVRFEPVGVVVCVGATSVLLSHYARKHARLTHRRHYTDHVDLVAVTLMHQVFKGEGLKWELIVSCHQIADL